MNKKLYLECTSGISGDMFVASLLDLGASRKTLQKALESLPVQGFQTAVTRVKKSGLDACDFDVILDKDHENHDHDMNYLYGVSGRYPQMETPGGEDAGCHAGEEPGRETIHQEQRGLKEILTILEKADITEAAKKTASDIFQILAKAEAKVHGTEMEEVHFHEVGAVDSIVDIVAAAVCLDDLEIDEVIVPVLYEGRGEVRCLHGILPIPVPAVTEIVKEHRIPLHIMEARGEFVTPTGAAIVAAVRTATELPKQFYIVRTGLGAGKREHEKSGILRAMLIEEA